MGKIRGGQWTWVSQVILNQKLETLLKEIKNILAKPIWAFVTMPKIRWLSDNR